MPKAFNKVLMILWSQSRWSSITSETAVTLLLPSQGLLPKVDHHGSNLSFPCSSNGQKWMYSWSGWPSLTCLHQALTVTAPATTPAATATATAAAAATSAPARAPTTAAATMGLAEMTDLVVKYLTGVGHLVTLAEKAAKVFMWWRKSPVPDEEQAFGDRLGAAARGVWRTELGRLQEELGRKEKQIVDLHDKLGRLRAKFKEDLQAERSANDRELAEIRRRLGALEETNLLRSRAIARAVAGPSTSFQL
ncbi:hypothetical protein NOF04DRAFT_8173 [Fusarium oxysporum II5]|uniref:Uncharacterized protein n=2 Tax=Fusarium oxysporum species complex TaxID=171631 RepID=X0K543_FUSO5|nr:uncharacterized protein FOIG_01745 [Fusarium odoratissimum NRRL 54006]EXM08669.1 hypothetical protein FOIG_01745 [Fusarium odoratissimum NRRL 54006]KAK2127820.1 hypothetical protein NOF04DRAFT_8173 [Fusarium oxysporum II5]TXC05656.1 hypothetical protein FocTR4_00009635 [Fusarium oxysporum f. sp. cubense]